MDHPRSGLAYDFGEYRLDAAEGRLERDGKDIPLSPTLLAILRTLVESGGRIVEKQRFMDHVWQGRVVEDGNLARNVSTLRKILDDDPQAPRYIETIPRRGYRFVADVEVRQAGDSAVPVTGLRADAGGRPAAPATRRVPVTSRVRTPAAFAAVLCALLAAGVLIVSTMGNEPVSPIRSLAVLPFANLSEDPEQGFFADGITESLISDLGKIGALSITSRTSSMHYRDTRKRLSEIAGELGVQGVVEGGVMRSGDRIRITARLVDASTDSSLWTETYERDLGDVFALQSEITRAIAESIDVPLTPEENRWLTATRAIDKEAHEAYLRGLFFKHKNTVDSLRKAVAYFEQSVEIEPNFAKAYAAMADTYLILASWQGPSRVLWPKAREAADRALEIDAYAADAHLVIAGALLCHDLAHSQADPVFALALELHPSNGTTHLRYSYSLMTQGRFEESLAEMRRSLELDPVSLANNTMLGAVLHFAGRYEDALEQLEHALELDSGYPEAHRLLGQVYLQIGMLEQAVLELEAAYDLGGGHGVLGEIAYAYALSGRTHDARDRLRTLEELSRAGQDAAFSLALVHHGLGDRAQTFAWLRKAYEERDFRMIRLLVDPIWDGLRSDPRFRELLSEIGLGSDLRV